MQKIIQANIDRFKLLLKMETDPEKLATIIRLLAEEEAKLRKPLEKQALASRFGDSCPV